MQINGRAHQPHLQANEEWRAPVPSPSPKFTIRARACVCARTPTRARESARHQCHLGRVQRARKRDGRTRSRKSKARVNGFSRDGAAVRRSSWTSAKEKTGDSTGETGACSPFGPSVNIPPPPLLPRYLLSLLPCSAYPLLPLIPRDLFRCVALFDKVWRYLLRLHSLFACWLRPPELVRSRALGLPLAGPLVG